MPEVLPFRGVRYAASRPATLSKLISPPYDAVSPSYRDELEARSPHNIIRLDLEKERPGDDAAENRYVRSGRWFEEWLADGTLRQDPAAAFYPVEQSFIGPDGRPRTRRGVVVACRLHRYEEGIVLPHEKTLSAPKADRLEILKRVKANLSPIFGLYEDDRGEGRRALDDAIASAEMVAEADSDDATHHRLWRVVDRAAVERLRAVLAERKVFIADGHHRYESALVYRSLVDAERPGLPDRAGHRYIMMTLCSMSDPGLVIYPTHRLLTGLRDFRLGRFLEELGRFFTVDTLLEDVRRPAGRAWAVSKLAEHAGKSTAFLMVTAEDGRGRILTLRDDADMSGVPLPSNVTLRDLDVTALHSVLFQHVLGLSPRSQELGENVRYEMDAGEVVTRTLAGEFQLGFLVNPTPMWQVQAVAESGETMPQKSTFFYPKLASGLVLRRIHEELG
ncbi:MAG TPA: DUF1015 domain-containing protein [Anaeromyxobacteraceae bacterium]|nr:DUF1015 domain-containing protein [Anaeromyxobacteraceae bacterium]